MASSFRRLMRKAAGSRSYPRSLLAKRYSSSSCVLSMVALLTLSLMLLLLLALGIFSLPVHSDSAPQSDAELHTHGKHHRNLEGLEQAGSRWTEVISWEPRAFIYHNFLSEEECDHLIELAKPHMTK